VYSVVGEVPMTAGMSVFTVTASPASRSRGRGCAERDGTNPRATFEDGHLQGHGALAERGPPDRALQVHVAMSLGQQRQVAHGAKPGAATVGLGLTGKQWFTLRMARPRVIADSDLLAAAQDLLFEVGPAAFTLEKSAARAGVSAATLIKRFGSKRELLLALNRRWVDSIGPGLAAAAEGHGTALGRLRAAALWGFEDLDSPANTASQLAALALDLQDENMRELLAEGWQLIQDQLARLARDAILAGELPGDPPAGQVARILLAAGQGTCLAWSVAPRGSLVARVGEDLDAILMSWAAPARG
jgi:AcrR family transcriptional regulator